MRDFTVYVQHNVALLYASAYNHVPLPQLQSHTVIA